MFKSQKWTLSRVLLLHVVSSYVAMIGGLCLQLAIDGEIASQSSMAFARVAVAPISVVAFVLLGIVLSIVEPTSRTLLFTIAHIALYVAGGCGWSVIFRWRDGRMHRHRGFEIQLAERKTERKESEGGHH